MKKYILILAALVISGSNLFSQAPQKSGYVDSQIIFAQFPEAIKVQGDLEAIFSKWNATVDSMTQVYQQGVTDYQKQAGQMTEVKKKEAEKKLVDLDQQILDFKKQKFAQGGEAYQKQEQLLKPVNEKIIKAIGEVAKEEGFNFVFNKSGDALLLYADSSFDLTFKVLDKLKRGK